MRLSKTTNYAIRILLDCAAASPDLVKVADISERRDISLQNTFKIVHLLSRAGFIQAVRGRHGGVRLSRPATDIRIGDVVRAMESLRLEVESEETGEKQIKSSSRPWTRSSTTRSTRLLVCWTGIPWTKWPRCSVARPHAPHAGRGLSAAPRRSR